MAKVSMKQRELKREKLVAKFAEKRNALLAIIKSPASSEEDVWNAQMALQKLPRDSSQSRLRSRCQMTGRPHGVYRKFKLSRIMIREQGMAATFQVLKRPVGKQFLRGLVIGRVDRCTTERLKHEYARYFGGYVNSYSQCAGRW